MTRPQSTATPMAPQARPPAPPPPQPRPPAPAAAGGGKAPPRPPGRLATFVRGRWLRTVPGRIRLYVAAALAATVLLLVALTVAIGNAREGVQTIGHDAGPQVVATGDLFFALSDMDAQVADVLLIGREQNLGIGRQAALQRYDQRRREAAQALVEASQLAGQDADRQRTVRETMEALGRYDRTVGRALVLSEQSGHAAGNVPPGVVAAYRNATELMRMELLPKAYNLTLDSGATVRQEYEDRRQAVLDGRLRVLLAGALLIVILLAAQFSLARGFRRTVNPALALATVGALVLVGAAFTVLSQQAGHIRTAKEDGFDSMLTLSRARAISHSAFADESRYLLDPRGADTYEQTYLDKVLSVLYIDPDDRPLNLETYYGLVDQKLATYDTPGVDEADFLGFFGDEARKLETAEQGRPLDRTLRQYALVLNNDRQMRARVAAGDRAGAIRLRTGRGPGGSIRQFEEYDRALVQQTRAHRATFDRAIESADGGLRGWTMVPPVAALVIAVLVLAGVRPRLAEFR
jgi:hypothetical protein